MGRTILFSYQTTSKKNYKFQGPNHVQVSVQNSLSRFRMSKILTLRVKEHVPNSHFQGSRMFKTCSFRKKNVPNSHFRGWRKFKIFTFRVEECSRFSQLQGWRMFKILNSRVQKCSRFSISGSKNVQDSQFQPGRRMFGQNSVFQGRTWMFKSLSFREETFVGTWRWAPMANPVCK